MASILILGGGFGGLAAANELRARLPDNHDVTVVAADDRFYTGFAKLWDLVGTRPLEQGTASLLALEQRGIHFVQARITKIDPAERRVETEVGSFDADFLLVALGAGPGPEQFLHLQGPAHDLYDANELPRCALISLNSMPGRWFWRYSAPPISARRLLTRPHSCSMSTCVGAEFARPSSWWSPHPSQ